MKNPVSLQATGVFDGGDGSRNIGKRTSLNNSGALKQDARILQFLKLECTRHGAGSRTLSKVFSGLLSVHNRNLTAFADALKKEEER